MKDNSERIIPTQYTTLDGVLAWAKPKVRNCHHANDFAMFMLPIIMILRSRGITGPSALARAMNERGQIRRNGKPWDKVSMYRLLDRLGPTLNIEVEVTDDLDLFKILDALGYY